MRLAAIDIGTNSVHIIVVQVRPDLSFEVVDREKEMVRLGAGGLDGKALTPSAMSATLQALSKFRRLADSHNVDEIIAAATSATREAENGGDFLNTIHRETGIAVKVISGQEEARLIHLAAAYGVDLAGRRGVVIDIGGGSVEITFGTARDAELARSFKIGVIRLTERFVRSDPIAGRDERRLVAHINDEIGAHIDQIVKRGYQRVIGTSGTILSLGSVVLAAETDSVTDVRNTRVPAKALHRLRKRLVDSDLQERLHLPGLDPRRADLVVAGSVLLDTILRRLGADELTLCDLALREGLILDYTRRNRRHIATIERFPDIRRRSVEELGERCHYWSEHARQVARLAIELFDQTQGLHGLATREREWLKFGALLHDVGVHISYKSHHKHSHYLILQRRPAGVRAAGNRSHRARRAVSPPGDAEEEPRRLRRAPRTAAEDGARPRGLRAARRGSRPQPRPGRRGARGRGPDDRPPAPGAGEGRCRARALGRTALPRPPGG